MSEVISSLLSNGFKKTYKVVASIRIYSATDLDHNSPLVATRVIGANPIKLPSIEDTVDEESLETIRDSWLYALSRTTHFQRLKVGENPLHRYISIEQSKDERAKLAQDVIGTRHPVPSVYVFSLPFVTNDNDDDRRHIISSLVPFNESRKLLLKMEETLVLPIASVNIRSWRYDA